MAREVEIEQFEMKLEMPHSKLSASSSNRWIACPGSVQAQQGLSDESSAAAEEGTALHEFSELCLREGFEPRSLVGEVFNGYTMNREQAGLVSQYVDHCRTLPKNNVLIERRLDYSMWADGGYGTADYLCFDEGEAWVVDAKFGRVPVSADSSQLKCYALGVLNDFGFDAQIDTVHMTVVQPRLQHIDTRTMRHTELFKWAREVLVPAATAAVSEDPPFNPGEQQCRYCKAAPTCRPLAQHVFGIIEEDFA